MPGRETIKIGVLGKVEWRVGSVTAEGTASPAQKWKWVMGIYNS